MRFDGDHSRIALRGASLIAGKQHADTTLVIDHAALHCESRERFKTRFGERAPVVLRRISQIVTNEKPSHVSFTIQFQDELL